MIDQQSQQATPVAPRSVIYFVGDVHLGAAIHADARAVEQRLCAWLRSVQSTAKAIYFLGDIFDYWFEYRYVVPKGHIRFLGALAQLADAGVELHMLAGNHDIWMNDYFTRELGVVIHHRAVVVDLMGKRFRLAHGDDECRGMSRANDFIYCLFRNPLCIRLFAAIHPRWTVGLALRWSLSNRRKHYNESQQRNNQFDIEQEWMVQQAKVIAESDPSVDFLIFGHRHMPIDLMLRNDQRLMIVSDWIRGGSFIAWDGQNIELHLIEDELDQ